MFYLLDGIHSEEREDDARFYIEEYKFGDVNKLDHPYTGLLYELDSQCVEMYDVFMRKIFNDEDEYYCNFDSLPLWVTELGHNSDLRGSKDMFGDLIADITDEQYNMYLYLSDCQSIISSIQNCIVTMNWCITNFYKYLAELDTHKYDEGVYMIQSPSVNLIYSFINNFIISSYSAFDLVTKLVYESENIITDFKKYPKLKSANKLYGDKKKLSCNDKSGTIFEMTEAISLIINLRNELIHNGSWEQHQKVEVHFSNGEVKCKYIYMPDHSDGNIHKFRNRKRFFSQESKINELLPKLYLSLINKISKSLDCAI